jgi:hypothetical protein
MQLQAWAFKNKNNPSHHWLQWDLMAGKQRLIKPHVIETYAEVEVQHHIFLTSALYVSGQLQSPS